MNSRTKYLLGGKKGLVRIRMCVSLIGRRAGVLLLLLIIIIIIIINIIIIIIINIIIKKGWQCKAGRE